MKWFYVIALLVAAAMVLSPFGLLKQEKLDRFAGKVVAYNIFSSKVNSIDPATCGDTTSSAIQGNFYEGLYTYHYLKRPIHEAVIPQLAEDMPEISPDGLTYTIKIKKNVKYSRNPCFGTETSGRGKYKTRTVTADDFVLAFKRIGDYHLSTKLSLAFIQDKILGLDDFRKKTKRYTPGDFSRYDKEELAGVTAVDEHTLQIRLKKRFPQFLYVLAMHVYAPIPREVIDYHLASGPSGRGGRVAIEMKERSTEIRNREAVVGTGPYVLTEWIRGGKIVMERNLDFRDDYYPSEGAPGDRQAGLLDDAGKKLPFVDVRHLTFVAEENPAWMLFLTKQRDIGGIPRDVFASVISPSRELTDRWRKRGIRLIKNPYPAIFWLAFNMEDPVVGSSRSLRQGLCLAFDVERYIDVIYNGRGKRAVNTIPSTFKGHAEAGAGPYYRLDVNLAKKKIEEAKKELAAKGLLKNGRIPELTLDLPGREERYRRIAEFVQGEFRKVGIELKVELNDWPTQQQKVHTKQCQMYAMGWHGDYPEAENFLQLYYGPNIDRGTNNTNYSNREFDRLFERAGTLAKIEDRVPLYAKMAGMISQDCPVLLLSEAISFSLVYGWVHNFKPHPIGYGLSKYTRLDVKARRKAGGRE